MDCGSRQNAAGVPGLLQIEDCLDAEGDVVMPPGATLISLIERNIANVGDAVAYRYLDYSRATDGQVLEVTLPITTLLKSYRARSGRVRSVFLFYGRRLS